jgi:O-antigen/teichoic acid export membrane protein
VDQNNKKIAINTIVVYGRIAVTMIIGVFTSRFVLQALGASDFGLYNVVGSVIGMYGFISGSLAGTTSRYINYEMGRKDGDTNKVFNACNVLHMAMAVVMLLILEIFGIWYIDNYLQVAPGKQTDAMFCFQVSTIVACIGIMNVPFQSIFQAHEKFFFMAVVDVLNKVLMLVFTLILLVYQGNVLRLYSVLMSILTAVTFIIYHVEAWRRWPAMIKWNFCRDKSLYKSVLSFNTWNLLGTACQTARSAGSNLILNLFFGTVVNAAYGIASTIQRYVDQFVSSFGTAAAPQITQNVSGNNVERTHFLANEITKITILLSIWVTFPLYLGMDTILRLWLKNPPEGTLAFCHVIMLVMVFATTSAGITQIIMASGKIKWFQIQKSFFFLISLPLSYIAYKYYDMPATTILWLFLISDIMQRIVQLYQMKIILHYDINEFMKVAYIRPGIVSLLMFAYGLIYFQIPLHGYIANLTGMFISFVFGSLMIYLIGFSKKERDKCNQMVERKIFRRR